MGHGPWELGDAGPGETAADGPGPPDGDNLANLNLGGGLTG